MDYINLILYIIIYIYCHMMRLSYSIPIEKFQFQCTGHSGTQLCVFPEQYCNDFYSECRPCSKDVCDKRDSKDFPLQCKYNCTGMLFFTLSVCKYLFISFLNYYFYTKYILEYCVCKAQVMPLCPAPVSTPCPFPA